MKDFAPWGYIPTAPFYIVSLASGVLEYVDRPFEEFDELLDIWVRQCLMPEGAQGPHAIILDHDGVPVIGWMKHSEGVLWLGLQWAWDKVTTERYPFLRPMMIEEARVSIISALEVGAP